MKQSEIHEWNAPGGYWYTENREREERSFVQHLRSQDEHFVNNYELWSDAQKEQWEKEHPEPEPEPINTENNDND